MIAFITNVTLNNVLQEGNNISQEYRLFFAILFIILIVIINKVFLSSRGRGISLFFENYRLRPLEPQYAKVISRYFEYYQKLPVSKQEKFEKRVQKFIDDKEFLARQMDKVTGEMKALIAASAIQLTFGLSNIYLAHFRKILIYPDAYFSTIKNQYHKGEVNPDGQLIVLSWKGFLEGYIDPNDSYNLGLHEMAHALLLENKIRNHENNFLSRRALKAFFRLADKEIQQIEQNEEHPIFRKYGAVNKHEFFAVAIETFFENPQNFRLHRPELYQALVNMLKQDPCKLYC